jgi:hypothetical protein
MGDDMDNKTTSGPFVLGVFICMGLVLLGYFISGSIIKIKAFDRTIEVKGLSEREVPANIAIWPIQFKEAGNDLNNLFSSIQRKNTIIAEFLKNQGFKENDISISAPAILDRQAQENTESEKNKYRYSGTSTVSVYTDQVDSVRNCMQKLVDLGKVGIAISGETHTLFLFTKLNDIKPAMIEEATKNAREVAVKFAQDSKSKLGRIKSAWQGQFSIEDRDNNTPSIKKVRVVSTVQYYLTD